MSGGNCALASSAHPPGGYIDIPSKIFFLTKRAVFAIALGGEIGLFGSREKQEKEGNAKKCSSSVGITGLVGILGFPHQ